MMEGFLLRTVRATINSIVDPVQLHRSVVERMELVPGILSSRRLAMEVMQEIMV